MNAYAIIVVHHCKYSISVIIPINTAAADINRCINSLLNNPVLVPQIIVAVNSDEIDELQKIVSIIPQRPCVEVIKIHKPGKSNAINKALRYVRNQYVLIGDADTIFAPAGLNSCIRRINSDKTIVAITGIVDPIRNNSLAALQKFEYRRVFRVFRPFWNIFNANILISGCVGLFRTDALRSVGPYDCNTYGEDFEITLRLHEYYIRHGIPYKIEFINRTVAKTDVPETLYDLIRQRGRWFAGQIEVLWKYRFLFQHPILYKRIIVPYVISIVFEVIGTCFKWVFFAISLRHCIAKNLPILLVFMISDLCFVLFECLFNIGIIRQIKVKTAAAAVRMTLHLIVLQFVLKDTNIFWGLPLVFKKNKFWNGRSKKKF